MSAVTTQSILNKSRQDKFILVLNLPDVLKKIDTSVERVTQTLSLDSLQYSVYGNLVPDISIPKVEAAFGGQTLNVTSYTRPSYAPVTVNFTVDSGFNNWWVLWKWLDLINDSKKGYFNANKLSDPNGRVTDSYMTNITLFGLDEYDKKKIQFDFNGAFIIGLGGINYNYRNGDQIEATFTFEFSQLIPQLL